MSITEVLTTAAAVGAATVGGLFFAFSTFTMRGLDRTGSTDAIRAMRGINSAAQTNVPFLLLFFASAVLALMVAVLGLLHLHRPGSVLLLIGGALSVLTIVITVAFNVPLNERLAALDPAVLTTSDAAREWADYYRPWIAWNHVRTVAPLVGAVLLLIGGRHA